MATPKPGDKNYKGPVHEVVRGAIKPIVDLFNPPGKAAPRTRRQPRKIGWDEMLLNNAGNARNTRAANRNKGIAGKSAEYDPLSSASGLTSKPKKRRTRTKKAKS